MTCTSRGAKFSKTMASRAAGRVVDAVWRCSDRAAVTSLNVHSSRSMHLRLFEHCTRVQLYYRTKYTAVVRSVRMHLYATAAVHLEHCRPGYNKVRYIVIRFTQPDRRKSMFGHSVTNAIKLI